MKDEEELREQNVSHAGFDKNKKAVRDDTHWKIRIFSSKSRE